MFRALAGDESRATFRAVVAAAQPNPESPILIADDESDDSFILLRRLKRAGVVNPVLLFRDGEELIQFLENWSETKAAIPVLLLLDLKMPRVDGFDVLTWLGHSRLKNLPVTVISGSSRTEDRDRALGGGAKEYFEKFPTETELSAMVTRASANPFLPE